MRNNSILIQTLKSFKRLVRYSGIPEMERKSEQRFCMADITLTPFQKHLVQVFISDT